MAVLLRNLTPGRVTGWTLLVIVGALLSACAGTVRPLIDADLPAFSAGVDGVLRAGMSLKEARAALRESFPRPSMNSEVAPSIPNSNRAMQNRRFMIGWPTTTRGTTMIVTLFCDREGTLVRWTTGPLRESS